MHDQIPRHSLVTNLTHELRQMILDGQIQPGDYLPSQKELAARFGVGLSTIHEAIQVLVAGGLLQARPGKGTWVNPEFTDRVFQPHEVKNRLGELHARQLYEARSVIEVALTRLAAERATSQDIQRIQNSIQAMQSAQDEVEFIEADLEFHQAVAAAAHSELLEEFYHLTRQLFAEVATELIHLPGVLDESIPLQGKIAENIAQHDSQAAQSSAMAHMLYIASLLDRYE
jgi:GntR family transcriptional repressor for pyruvate dehydrogenase complex